MQTIMSRSSQSLLPFILATLGCFVVLLAGDMPLFEWQIDKLVTDFPPTYKVRIDPSPWTSYLGDSLDDAQYVFRNVVVQRNGRYCRAGDLSFDIKRSRGDRTVENINFKSILWLSNWGYYEICLSLIYIWLFTIWHERLLGCLYAPVFTGIAGFIYLFISQIARVLASPFRLMFLGSDFGELNCHGTVTLNAEIARVHYETLIVLLIGILLELGTLGVILYQVRKIAIERKESSELAAG